MTVSDASASDRDWSGPTSVLAAKSRAMTEAEAESVFREQYGAIAQATPLRSERDQNFLMTSADGARVVLKLSNASQDPRLSRFQTRALSHIAVVDPDLAVPRVVPTTEGDPQFRWDDGGSDARLGYVVSFLEGTPVAEQSRSAVLAANMGAMAARLGRALRGFFDPAAGHELLWDFKHAGRLGELLPFVRSERDRSLAAAAVERFCAVVEPRLPGLRGQVIHNDLNPYNILAQPARPEVPTGIIDFGDMVHGALVSDVAVAAAYLIAEPEDPFAMIKVFVGAYHAVTPLEPEELDIIPDLIATRHTMTCAITGWRADRYPENASYILRNARGAVRGLEALSGEGRYALASQLAAVCGL